MVYFEYDEEPLILWDSAQFDGSYTIVAVLFSWSVSLKLLYWAWSITGSIYSATLFITLSCLLVNALVLMCYIHAMMYVSNCACSYAPVFIPYKPAIVGLLWIGLLWHFPRSALLSVIRVKECHACLHICIVTAIVIHICHNVIDGFAWLALTDHVSMELHDNL